MTSHPLVIARPKAAAIQAVALDCFGLRPRNDGHWLALRHRKAYKVRVHLHDVAALAMTIKQDDR